MSTSSNDCPLSEILSSLGSLAEYPKAGFCDLVARTKPLITGEAQPRFDEFASTITQLSPDAREELYTGTFDVTPACVPYVSIHLFGEENFKRGEFMAALNARYAAIDFSPNGDLPDHFANLLRYAAAVDAAERQELVHFCLLGPLAKMARGLHQENPYRALLEVILTTLAAAYPGLRAPLSPLEQMQQHGTSCAAVSSGCGCGSHLTSEAPPSQLSRSEPALT
jgi:nitrate reductase molybdenum cofactor assembly chaperone NarJ/NarW